jgi:outer membrane protein
MRAICAATLLALLFSTASYAEPMKLAVVDVEKAILSIADGKAAKSKLEREAKKKQKALDKEQKELVAMKEQLERQASLLQDSVKRQKAMEMQRRYVTLQEQAVQMQQELKQKEAKLFKPIFEKINTAIEAVAKKHGFKLVLEKRAGVLYATDALDITDKVIKAYK